MSTETNKAIARRWFTDIIAQGRLDVADEVFDANHVIHDPHAPPGGWPTGPEGPKLVTHTAPLLGAPPSGRRATVTGANIARFANGKIVESWFNFDMLTLLQQIGVIPMAH
jgi:hypothetical protein